MSNLFVAKSGYGSILSMSSLGSSGTFSPLAGITDMAAPKKTLGVIDITYHGTTDSYDLAIPGGIFKQADLTMTGIMITCSSFFNMDGSSAFGLFDLKTWMEAGSRIGWKINVGNTSSQSLCYFGDGFITAFGIDTPFNDVVKFTATISPTGKPVVNMTGTTTS
jgi:hypothetical protein